MAKSVRERAMDFLARREHSVFELKHKLLSKGLEQQEIEDVTQTLVAEGLLSDARFTEAFIYSRTQRGSGPYKIRAELRQKGISDAMIDEFLDERDSLWLNLAQEVRARKFGSLLPEDMNDRARQARFLQQRGFTHEQTRSVLRDNEF